MATIIDLGDGRFLAGDPDIELGERNHWCAYCRGDGLELDMDDELTTCLGCSGVGQVECDDPDCEMHS